MDSEISCNCVSTMTPADINPAGIKGNKLLISGDRTHLTFSGNYMDLYGKAGSVISGGKIDLTAYNMGIWMDNNQYNGNSAMISGGTITAKNASSGIHVENIVLNLTGGSFTTDATVSTGVSVFYGIAKFAGIEADIRAKNSAVSLSSSPTASRCYKVLGGTLTMRANSAAIVYKPYELCDGYAVYAGNDADTAAEIKTPDDNNVRKPYVRIEPTQTHTLTLENVMGGATTAKHGVGASFTYNAKRPEVGKHFDHWELTVGDSTTSVGTESSYTATMPDSDAKLTAVYVSCSGGSATCTQKAECAVCGEEYGDYVHDFTAEKAEEKYLASAATCTQAAKYYKSCAVCGLSSKDTEQEATFASGSALGHDYKSAVTAPTCTAQGYTTHVCSRCADSRKDTFTDPTGHNFVYGACTVCGAKEPTAATCPVERFTDCPEAWYHEAIDFVAANKLMLGVSPTAFAPEDTLTRAMAVTVFHRMAGSPKVSVSATFTDVPVGDYFSEAVAWAQAQGVVNGVSPTVFAPNEPITREQIAAILWRYSGSPKVNGDLSKFVDAAKISDYAVDAFKWASAEGIFNGDEKGRLNPTDNATRAEFATIIKNYLAGTYSCPKLAK